MNAQEATSRALAQASTPYQQSGARVTGGMRLIYEDGRVEETRYSLHNMIYAIDHMRIEGQPEPPRPVVRDYMLQGRDY